MLQLDLKLQGMNVTTYKNFKFLKHFLGQEIDSHTFIQPKN